MSRQFGRWVGDMTDAVVLGVLGAFQAITIAYLEHGRRQAKKQCGTTACVKAIKEAINKGNQISKT